MYSRQCAPTWLDVRQACRPASVHVHRRRCVPVVLGPCHYHMAGYRIAKSIGQIGDLYSPKWQQSNDRSAKHFVSLLAICQPCSKPRLMC
uniref:Uncharacterized protein n=1 Tax=Romanomermis culicivorax TaxID=13658 RepID=A0A915KUK5_ROMCU